MKFFNSRYNFCFNTENGKILYNSNTGSTFSVKGNDSIFLSTVLTGEKKEINKDFLEDSLFDLLLTKGFLIQSNRNELLEIRERYWVARGNTPMVLTITTTMNCNLACYYCYEERTDKKLQFDDVENLISQLEKCYNENPFLSLHVDWYGGEPLLNINFLEKSSYAIQKFCISNQINYHSSIISNGTEWPDDFYDFINNHKIRQVQISFDGLKKNHKKSRRYRKEYFQKNQNSFDLAFNLVSELLDIVQVDVRFNIDWNSKNDIYQFLDLIVEEGWFNKKHQAVFQPARIASYSEKSSFMKKKQLSIEEFDEIKDNIATRLKNVGKIEESEVPDGFPFPKNYVCAALASKSMVIGADKLIYRCGLQVGETHRAVGSINNSDQKFNDIKWWELYDPTRLNSCSKCSFLPVCLGGCPKKHLEKDQFSLDEQSYYWRNNLEKKVVTYVNEKLIDNKSLLERDQFRIGYD